MIEPFPSSFLGRIRRSDRFLIGEESNATPHRFVGVNWNPVAQLRGQIQSPETSGIIEQG